MGINHIIQFGLNVWKSVSVLIVNHWTKESGPSWSYHIMYFHICFILFLAPSGASTPAGPYFYIVGHSSTLT